MTLNVNNLDLKLLKKINFGHKYKHSGERFSYIDYERNGHWSVEVLSLVSGKVIFLRIFQLSFWSFNVCYRSASNSTIPL